MKFVKRLLLAGLFLGAVLLTAWLFRTPLLRSAAHAWIVNQPLAHAEAIVVLGGGLDTRPAEAARLYHLGLAPKILVLNPRLSAAAELGLEPTEGDLARQILLKKDVPPAAIVTPPNYVTNSFDEAITVRNWARQTGARRVIIPTDIFHTRRVRWLYGRELRGTGLRVQVEGVPVRDYSADDWWHHEQGLIAFQNEVLKYAFYRLKY